MARFKEFPQANFLWRGVPADGDRPAVGDLPAYRDDQQSISCWELTEEELAEIQKTGVVWLHVLGAAHPPVAVMGTNPFEEAANDG